MVGDWIKMRTDMYRDPKVILMADQLMAANSKLSRYVNQHCQCDMSVTSNVMRNVTVGALVSVWGVARHQGKRVGDDLLMKMASLKIIDSISDIPGFGDVMESVGWCVVTPEGLVFPAFYAEMNVDPVSQNAERQKRYRDRHKESNSNGESNVTRNVTRNDRGEERRVEKSNGKETKAKKRFAKPTVDEVRAYCLERKNGIDPEAFVNFYESKGWVIGKSPMKSWKSAIVTWEKQRTHGSTPAANRIPTDDDLANYTPY